MTAKTTDVSTFRADSVNEAIVKVKMKLGSNAEIVETREVTEGGILGFFGDTRFEVDAYVPPDANPEPSPGLNGSSNDDNKREQLQEQIRELSQQIRPDRNGDRSSVSNSNGKPAHRTSNENGEGKEWNVDDPVMPEFSSRDRAKRLIEEKTGAVNGNGSPDTYSRKSMNGSSTTSPSSSSSPSISAKDNEKEITRLVEKTDLIAEKMDSLVESVEEKKTETDDSSAPDFPGELNELYHGLIARDVEKKFARDLVGRVRRQLEAEEFHEFETIQQQMKQEIEEEFVAPDALVAEDEGPLLVPFVGPTGVGKTTTIAKLAAYYSVEESRSVGFITLDGYRLAAVEQLRRYADILRVPLEDVTDRNDVESAIENLSEQDVEIIFVDTAGRSQFDEEKIREIEDVFPDQYPVKTHLVMSAKCRSRDLKSVLDGFDGIGYDRLAITKLDETEAHGMVYNLMRRSDSPMAYFTDGQEVPDDLWIAEPDFVSNLIVNEGDE